MGKTTRLNIIQAAWSEEIYAASSIMPDAVTKQAVLDKQCDNEVLYQTSVAK